MTGTGAALVCASSAVAPRNNGSMQISFFWFLVMRRRNGLLMFLLFGSGNSILSLLTNPTNCAQYKRENAPCSAPSLLLRIKLALPPKGFSCGAELAARLVFQRRRTEPKRSLCRGILGRAASFVQ